MKNYITSSKKKSPSSVLFFSGAVNTIFFNEIGDYEKNEIQNELYLDLRRKGFVEIAYSYYSEDDFNSNNNGYNDDNEENYFIYFYNKNGDMIFAKKIPLLKKKDEEQNGSMFVSFVPYNNTNASVYAYAIVKEDSINKKQLIQFVSMDDVVTGREGPANGIQSKIFGLHLIPRSLQQDDSSPIQQASFSLVGSGCDPNSFTPIIETRPTPGQINPGQTFTDCRTISPPLQPNDEPPLNEGVANTFATTLGNNNSRGGLLGAESFVGIAIAALVVIVALFVGGRKYSTRWRNESEEEEFKYFEGGDDIEAQIIRTTTAPDVPESIPEKLTLSNIKESLSEKIRITSRESNKMDDSSVSIHSNVRISSLISSKDLQYRTKALNQNPKKEDDEEEEVSTILITSDDVGSKTQPAEESVLENENDRKDDTSASTTTVRAKSLLSTKNLPTLRSTTASIITSVVESNRNESKTPVTSDVAVSNKEKNEIKPLYGLSEWKIFGAISQQPSSQQHHQEDDDTISESSSSFIFTKSRSLMSKFF